MFKLASASTIFLLALSTFSPAHADDDIAKPIRQAVVRAQIIKSSYVKNPIGDYDMKMDVVCTKTAKIDVFDNRGSKRRGGIDRVLECDSTAEGKPVTVTLSGQVNITDVRNPITKQNEDVKMWNPLLMVRSPGQREQQASTSVIATKDLGLKSLVTELFPADFLVECSANPPKPRPSSNDGAFQEMPPVDPIEARRNCSVSRTEVFSAHVELEDAP